MIIFDSNSIIKNIELHTSKNLSKPENGAEFYPAAVQEFGVPLEIKVVEGDRVVGTVPGKGSLALNV